MTQKVHILDRVCRSSDPDGRSEAMSFCGVFEECSGSGRHGMATLSQESNCDVCKARFEKWVKKMAREYNGW